MQRQTIVRNAYALVGRLGGNYDAMMRNKSLFGKFAIRFLWQLQGPKYAAFSRHAFDEIPKNFAGALLEVPVGTGALSLPFYRDLPDADITCLDYSGEMLKKARRAASALGLLGIRFEQGDVGALPFADGAFDRVLSLNGLHAFPEKERALQEMHRVLRPGGIFSGTCYVRGESRVTDAFVRSVCSPCGFFTPPFDTARSLARRLHALYAAAEVKTAGPFACFLCRK